MKSNHSVFVKGTFLRLLVILPAIITLTHFSVMGQDCTLKINEVLVHPTCEGMEMGLIKVSIENAIGKYDMKWSGPGKLSDEAIQANLKQGRYQLTVSDEAGCVSKKSFSIRSNPKPRIKVVSEDTFEKKRGTAKLDIAGKRPYKVQWANSKGKVIGKGEDVQRLTEGRYFFTVIDANKCFAGGSVKIN